MTKTKRDKYLVFLIYLFLSQKLFSSFLILLIALTLILLVDYSKAKAELGWEPKVKFEELVKIMIEADLANEKKNL